MANWCWRTVKGYTYLSVYRRVAGKQVSVPRDLYKHLDGAPDHNIQAWVDQWTLQHETAKVTPDNMLYSDDALSKHVDEWLQYLARVRKRARSTQKEHASLLRRFAFPYFLELGLKNPAQWPGVSIGLYEYLQKYECSQTMIANVNSSLRLFFSWCQDEGIVAWEGALKLRNSPAETNDTPLSFALKPEEVLEFARLHRVKNDVKFLALCGYFLSLRPQETFAIKPEDFRSGKDISFYASVVAAKKAGLDYRLAINVQQQQNAAGEITPPKSYSQGWVCCFNKNAAELIATIVNTHKGNGQILTGGNRSIYRRWARATKGTKLETIDLKDLRRASIYWLGHNTKLLPLQIMHHARHKEFETTQLYLRQPKEGKPKGRTKLKLGA